MFRREFHRRRINQLAAIALVILCESAIVPSMAGVAFGKQETSAPATPPAAPRIVTDEAGRRVSVPADVKRIVSLAPNLTETVYALGLGDRLAGDTNYCDTPPAAKTKPHVGEPQNPSLEAIVALRPDLVLATTSINREETVDALARLGVAVYTSDPHTVQGMLDSVSHMADVMGAAAQGAELVSGLQARLDALHARLDERPMIHVLFVVWQEPLITVGQNTFIADSLRYAGAESAVIAKQNWPQIGLEEVVRLQPDYILFADNHEGAMAEHLSDLRARPTWKELDAVRLGHVVTLSEEMTRPSPGLVDSIELLAREIHPEAFAEKAAALDKNSETAKGCSACAR